ncbi:antibiotic biosynthesis monooxygenase family protein [uncultured Jatrophihabitans sp.]|uniref:antibiotic biosynthesis monooxygenase family protein n=1 Tax=uncultured Jatrophihabitans sp. TaxID=1610747 RepID=UPI0035CA71DD
MIAITHFTVGAGEGDDGFVARAQPALDALSRCAGYQRGSLGRSTDDPGAWVLLTEWTNVGSYRRALGNYQVKLHATPLLAQARDLPGGFETIVDVAPGGETVVHASDREPLA